MKPKDLKVLGKLPEQNYDAFVKVKKANWGEVADELFERYGNLSTNNVVSTAYVRGVSKKGVLEIAGTEGVERIYPVPSNDQDLVKQAFSNHIVIGRNLPPIRTIQCLTL